MPRIKKTTTVVTEEIVDATPTKRLVALIDRSGSMATNWKATLETFNAFIKGLPGDTQVRVYAFDSHQHGLHGSGLDLVLFREGAVDGFVPLSAGEIQPRGGTPLFDAIGRTVGLSREWAKPGDRLQLLIYTDGEENSSREYTGATIKTLLSRLDEVDKWLVTFLGADVNAWVASANFMPQVANTMAGGMHVNSGPKAAALRQSTVRYYDSGSTQSANFTPDEQKELKK